MELEAALTLSCAAAVPATMARPSAAERVRRARRGDVAAFESLYRETVGRVYAVCLRMVGDPARAEDLTQETFVRAWQRLGSFRGDSAFSTWVHRVAVNVVLSRARSRGPKEEKTVHSEEIPRGAGEAPRGRPPEALDLERAIAGLPPKARAVFVLFEIEGYRHHEIAARMGISEGTSKAHLHRARRLLREALER